MIVEIKLAGTQCCTITIANRYNATLCASQFDLDNHSIALN